MDITKYADSYVKSLLMGLNGDEFNNIIPYTNTPSPYNVEANEELEVNALAYETGKAVRDNVGGGSGGTNPPSSIPEHNHDDRYAKIIHDHDTRYYTKEEENAWRDKLINGNLLFNKINANHIQAGTIVAGSNIIGSEAVGSSQISKLSADKIDAGTIDSSKVTISGANGNLKLHGNRMQVFEGIGLQQFERISLGDVDNDGSKYGLRVRGIDGQTILYDENGVYREGITDGSINNDKIGGDANIDGGKLNITSVINKINDNNDTYINGVKVGISVEGIETNVYEIFMTQNEHSETIKRQQAEITQNKNNIILKVDEQKYTEDMSSMTSELNKQTGEIKILKEGLELSASKTEVSNQINNLKDFVSDEIGDISVGGANFVNNSAPRKAILDQYLLWDKRLNGNHKLVHWQDYQSTVALPEVGYHAHIDLKSFHFPCIAFENLNGMFNMANRYLGIIQEVKNGDGFITFDEEYTISFDAYSESPFFDFHGGLYHRVVESMNYGYHSGKMSIRIRPEDIGTWKRYSYTFRTHKGINLNDPIYLMINGHNNIEAKGYIKNIKLENGRIVSQWTPSQFDVDEGLDDVVNSMKEHVNNSIKTNNASLDIKFDGITSKVEETIKDIDGVRVSVSEVKQTASEINSKVTDLNGKYTELKQTVDGFDFTGLVTFYDLSREGGTVINGSNIKTGYLSLIDEIGFVGGARITKYKSSYGYAMHISSPGLKIDGNTNWSISERGELSCRNVTADTTMKLHFVDVYSPYAGSSYMCDTLKLGSINVSAVTGTSIHLITSSGGKANIYSGSTYTTRDIPPLSVLNTDSNVFDVIDNLSVIDGKTIVHNDTLRNISHQKIDEYVKVDYDNVTSITNNGNCIALLIDAVKTLKQEIEILKKG